MKRLIILSMLLFSQLSFADLMCQGSGLEITIYTSGPRAEIRQNGNLT